jgi:hypothetical protein
MMGMRLVSVLHKLRLVLGLVLLNMMNRRLALVVLVQGHLMVLRVAVGNTAKVVLKFLLHMFLWWKMKAMLLRLLLLQWLLLDVIVERMLCVLLSWMLLTLILWLLGLLMLLFLLLLDVFERLPVKL